MFSYIKEVIEDHDWEIRRDYYGRYGSQYDAVIIAPEADFVALAKELCENLKCGGTPPDKREAELTIIQAALSRIDSMGKFDSVFALEGVDLDDDEEEEEEEEEE